MLKEDESEKSEILKSLQESVQQDTVEVKNDLETNSFFQMMNNCLQLSISSSPFNNEEIVFDTTTQTTAYEEKKFDQKTFQIKYDVITTSKSKIDKDDVTQEIQILPSLKLAPTTLGLFNPDHIVPESYLRPFTPNYINPSSSLYTTDNQSPIPYKPPPKRIIQPKSPRN